MARTFHRKQQLHPVAELNITNLVDLGFTLLIIFMIATPLISNNTNIPIDLPVQGSKTEKAPKDKEQAIRIGVDRNGNYFWNDSPRPVNLAQIRVNLQAMAESPKPPVIFIDADFRLQYQQVVAVLDEVKNAGLSRISLSTQQAK